MRVVQFIQVVVLLCLCGYVVVLQLENPLVVRLPLPFGDDPSVPLGALLAGALLVGAVYASLLYLPRLALHHLRRRRDLARRTELEARLRATLQAKFEQAARPPAALSGQDLGESPVWDDSALAGGVAGPEAAESGATPPESAAPAQNAGSA